MKRKIYYLLVFLFSATNLLAQVATKADLNTARSELKTVKEELKRLKTEFDRLTNELAQATQKQSMSEEVTNKLKACNIEKLGLTKQVALAEADREDLRIKLMQVIEQLRVLMEKVKHGQPLTVQAIVKTEPLAPIAVPVIPTPTEKPAIKKKVKKAKKAKKKKGKKAAKKKSAKKTKKARKKKKSKKIGKKKVKKAKKSGKKNK